MRRKYELPFDRSFDFENEQHTQELLGYAREVAADEHANESGHIERVYQVANLAHARDQALEEGQEYVVGAMDEVLRSYFEDIIGPSEAAKSGRRFREKFNAVATEYAPFMEGAGDYVESLLTDHLGFDESVLQASDEMNAAGDAVRDADSVEAMYTALENYESAARPVMENATDFSRYVEPMMEIGMFRDMFGDDADDIAEDVNELGSFGEQLDMDHVVGGLMKHRLYDAINPLQCDKTLI